MAEQVTAEKMQGAQCGWRSRENAVGVVRGVGERGRQSVEHMIH